MVVNAAQAEDVLFAHDALDDPGPGRDRGPDGDLSAGGRGGHRGTRPRHRPPVRGCPVSGGVVGAKAAKLTIMAAAPAATLAAIRPVPRRARRPDLPCRRAAGPGRHRQGGEPAPVRRPYRGPRRGDGPGRAGRGRLRGGAGDPLGLLGRELDAARPRAPDAGGGAEVTSAVDIFVKDLGIVLEAGRSAGAALPLAALPTSSSPITSVDLGPGRRRRRRQPGGARLSRPQRG